MSIPIYQVDAFTDSLFSGNPAAVCPLDKWLPDLVMQNIAGENNLAETAFVVMEDNGYRIRWFTPVVEVDLCGHATLAAAHVFFHHEKYMNERITFNSRSGPLTVTKRNGLLTLNFPKDTIIPTPITPELAATFSLKPMLAFKGKTDYLLVYESESQIKELVPNLSVIATLKARGIIVTAKGNQVDFVSRFFAPQSGVNEDPVTGSAHTTLIPYWASVLNKTEMDAVQCSARTGRLGCSLRGDRVEISGNAKTFLIGKILIE